MPGNVNEREPDERIVEIEVERLRDFHDHPFKVRSDQQMFQLMESISRFGILNPLIVRPVPDGVYEIISGHRRKYAAIQLGYRKLPVIIRFMKDEDAVINMIDSNLQREMLLPSEKAFAYKMKYEALRRKSGRKKGGQVDHQLNGRKTVQILCEEAGESSKQIQRYLKLTELIPELRERLDEGLLSFTPAFEISFLKEEEQRDLIRAMDFSQASPSLSQAQRMKKLSREGTLTLPQMKEILGEVKKGEVNRVMFKNEQLYRFFPKDYTAEHMKQAILEILKQWMEQDLEKETKKMADAGFGTGKTALGRPPAEKQEAPAETASPAERNTADTSEETLSEDQGLKVKSSRKNAKKMYIVINKKPAEGGQENGKSNCDR